MKKRIMIATLCILFMSAIVNRSSAHIAAGIIVGEPTGLSLKFDRFPVLGIAWSLQNYMHIHCDYWLVNSTLSPPVRWYAGVGLKTTISNGNNGSTGVGVRIPVGLQFFLNRQFELFGELVPGVSILPNTGLLVNGGIGIRFHFR